MVDIQWIKLSTELFTNRKIMMIREEREGDKYALFWVFLLTLAGRLNSDGALMLTENIPYTVKILAKESGFSRCTVEKAIEVFMKYDMLYESDGRYIIKNWIKYQNADGLYQIREKTRLRVAKYRERQGGVAAAEAVPEKEKGQGGLLRHCECLPASKAEAKRILDEEAEKALQHALARSFPIKNN